VPTARSCVSPKEYKARENAGRKVYMKKEVELFQPKVIVQDDKRHHISFRTVFTIVIIFMGSLGTALTYAITTDTRHQISLVLRETQEQKEANTALRAENAQRYTMDEVARIASDKMGMNRPDPSQILYISVPKQSYVVLNPGFEEEPDEINYFWQAIKSFFGQFIDRY
jgi:cell division protein FtsL